MRHCAFVNYTKKEDCEKAIQDFHVSMFALLLCSVEC